MDIDRYKKRVGHQISGSTLSSRVSALRSLDNFIGGGEPIEQDVEDWVEYLMSRDDVKNSTIREYFKTVRSYFRIVKGENDPLEAVERWVPSNDSDPGDFLTVDEWEALLSKIYNPRNKAVYSIMYHYARRPSEILFLNKEDVDFDEMTIRFLILKKTDPTLPDITIGGETRKLFRATYELKEEPAKAIKRGIKYGPEIVDTIKEDGEEREVYPLFTTSEGRLSYDTVYNAVKKASDAAGIKKNVTPKTMRHSRATHLDWNGHAPGNIGRDMLIHSPDTNVVGRYIHDREGSDVREPMELKVDEE